MIIKEEMKKQFGEIISSLYNYHDQIEGDNSLLSQKSFNSKEGVQNENDVSSSEEEEVDIEHNIKIDDI